MTETMPTTERLAQALEAGGAPIEMVARARDGYYDDFKSELATPCIQLVADLHEAGLIALRQRAIDGEFDSTPEESAAWFDAEGKYLIGSDLLHGGETGYFPKHREPKGFGRGAHHD